MHASFDDCRARPFFLRRSVVSVHLARALRPSLVCFLTCAAYVRLRVARRMLPRDHFAAFWKEIEEKEAADAAAACSIIPTVLSASPVHLRRASGDISSGDSLTHRAQYDSGGGAHFSRRGAFVSAENHHYGSHFSALLDTSLEPPRVEPSFDVGGVLSRRQPCVEHVLQRQDVPEPVERLAFRGSVACAGDNDEGGTLALDTSRASSGYPSSVVVARCSSKHMPCVESAPPSSDVSVSRGVDRSLASPICVSEDDHFSGETLHTGSLTSIVTRHDSEFGGGRVSSTKSLCVRNPITSLATPLDAPPSSVHGGASFSCDNWQFDSSCVHTGSYPLTSFVKAPTIDANAFIASREPHVGGVMSERAPSHDPPPSLVQIGFIPFDQSSAPFTLLDARRTGSPLRGHDTLAKRPSPPGRESSGVRSPRLDIASLVDVPTPPSFDLVALSGGKLYVPAKPGARPNRRDLRKRAVEFADFREAREPLELAIPAGTTATRRPGISRVPELEMFHPESSAEAKALAKRKELERIISIFSDEMATRLVPFDESELAQSPNRDALVLSQLRSFLSRQVDEHPSSCANARRALLSLHDFALGVGVTLVNFRCSVGLLSAYLTAQVAPTMARARLTAFKFAEANWRVEVPGSDPVLKVFSVNKSTGEAHALTTPVAVLCHAAVIASDTQASSEYVAGYAAGFVLGGGGSTRFGDLQQSTVTFFTKFVEGYGPSKTGKAFWWAERIDLLGGEKWIATLKRMWIGRSKCDYVFRRAIFASGHDGDPSHFEGWADGPAPRRHVRRALVHMLTLPPLSLAPDVAVRYARLHGLRRVYPTLGRFMSSELQLTTDDRQELGRWAQLESNASRAARGEWLCNRYGSDAARPRALEVRKKVGVAARAKIQELGWTNLPVEGGGFELFMAGDVDVVDPEPDLSSDEEDIDDEIEPMA